MLGWSALQHGHGHTVMTLLALAVTPCRVLCAKTVPENRCMHGSPGGQFVHACATKGRELFAVQAQILQRVMAIARPVQCTTDLTLVHVPKARLVSDSQHAALLTSYSLTHSSPHRRRCSPESPQRRSTPGLTGLQQGQRARPQSCPPARLQECQHGWRLQILCARRGA